MRAWPAVIKKEFIVLGRDIHALMVLFAMPVAFILIMSLSMRDEYASHGDVIIEVLVVDRDGGPLANKALGTLAEASAFRFVKQPEGMAIEELREAVQADRHSFVLLIPPNYFERFEEEDDVEAADSAPIQIFVAPSVRKPTALLLEGAVREAVAKVHLNLFLRELRELEGGVGASVDAEEEEILAADAIELVHTYGHERRQKPPSAVQQNVPAWLVFSMFFVVIPISTTFIAERQQGTLGRLRTMNISIPLLLASKLVPYILINQVQVAIMLCVGVYLVPLLGGDALSLVGSRLGLFVIALAVSFGAISYALLISVIARTTEQAATLGGIGNIILGAMGGIMVPKFVMPEYMQGLTNISPMAWGLEGFLDILLRQGSLLDVLPEVAALVAFGFVSLAIAVQLFSLHTD